MVEVKSNELKQLAEKAKIASCLMAGISTTTKNDILNKIAEELILNKNLILLANEKDLTEAKMLVEKGELSQPLYKRLALTEAKFNEMVQGIKDVAKLEDPVGKVFLETELDDGLILRKISCPIGVIGIIFEARPEVVVQISSLAIKSSNVVILKGGSEALNTNIELVRIINNVLLQYKEIPEGAINLIKTREEVKSMLELDEYIDLLIPRGSNEFVKYIQNNTRIPVLGHSDGICHIYVDESIDEELASKVIIDSKTDYPAACNAVETLLIHRNLSNTYVVNLLDKLQSAGVEVLLPLPLQEKRGLSGYKSATEEDWKTEYTDLILSVKEVESLLEAINHINKYGSGHTDCIITNNKNNAEEFMGKVDSAGVYWNASTRFADGFRYGFGAEVGISTNKTHARGPVGLEGLLIYKYQLIGQGQVVADYSKGVKTFKHRKIK